MVKTQMQVLGLTEVTKMLNTKSKNVQIKAQEAIKQAGFFMQGEVKESIAGHRAEHVSVDTGRFLNSIHTEVGKLQATVSDAVSYGQALEYGTSKMAPRRHFQNSLARNKNKIIEKVEAYIKQI